MKLYHHNGNNAPRTVFGKRSWKKTFRARQEWGESPHDFGFAPSAEFGVRVLITDGAHARVYDVAADLETMVGQICNLYHGVPE